MSANTGTLTLNGTTLPYQVNTIRQLKAFTQAVGVEMHGLQAQLQDLGSKTFLEAMPLFVAFAWSAVYAAAMQASGQCDVTQAQVAQWAEDSEISEITKPMLTFGQLQAEKKS